MILKLDSWNSKLVLNRTDCGIGGGQKSCIVYIVEEHCTNMNGWF